MKNKLNLENKNDFGFHFEEHQDYADEDHTKAQEIYDAIMPLLYNLKKNPEKPNIVWPDRTKNIDIFIEKLNNILNR